MNGDDFILYVQNIVAEIYESVGGADFMNPAEEEMVKEKIRLLMRRFDLSIEQVLPQSIIAEFFGGVDEAALALVDNGIDVATGLAIGAGGVIAPEFRVPVYLDPLQEIMDDSFLDLKAARRMAEANAIGTIDKAIGEVKAAIAQGIIQGNPRKVMQTKVMTAFRENGLTSFLTEPDKNGVQRRLPLDFYAMTVTRYKVREAGVQGSVTRYTENNQDLVQIIERSSTCGICGKFKGMVVSLTGNTPGYPKIGDKGVKLPPYHPNCYGTTRVFVVKRKTPEEIAAAKARNAEYKEDEDTRTPAQKAAYKKEQEKRRIANEEKKQFMRFNQILGADNFKTLGAFRKAKRENSPKFQELQSNYRSAMQNRIK